MKSIDTVINEKAARTMAHMLDFAVHDLRQDAAAFFDLFISSGLADIFARRDILSITGTSGVELAYRVLEASGAAAEHVSYRYTPGRSREYWTGHALGRYSMETGTPFADIISAVPVRDLIALCDRYRSDEIRIITESLSWMDTLKVPDHMNDENYLAFSSHLDKEIAAAKASSESKLKLLRLRSGYSQSGLAAASGIPVRTIQQYEQRQKDIKKAGFESIIKLAAALSCEPSDLI